MGQPKHILIVDDDGDVRDVISEVLRNYGYRVGSASDGAAMRDFIEAGDPVDCVILDAFMPGEASISLADYLRNRKIPVVVISGSRDAITYAEENDPSSSKSLFARKSFTAPLQERSPAASSDSDRWINSDADKNGEDRRCPVGTCLIGPAPAQS
jgi:CheY-like chemotaxis protein